MVSSKFLGWACQERVLGIVQEKIQERDFPGGPVVKNPPSSARDAGLILGQGTKIPHALGQLNPHTTTTELVHLN